MSEPAAPGWWVELQRDFGAALRTPLRSAEGRFEPDPRAASPALLDALRRAGSPAVGVSLDAGARLGVYQTQYWMRLFETMQTAFPRLTHVVGPWRFNHLAQVHLVDRPPAHPDLDRCADGFHDRTLRALDRFGGASDGARGNYRVESTSLAELSLAPEAGEDPYCRELALVRVPRTLVRQASSMDEAQRRAMLARTFRTWSPPSLDPEQLGDHRLRFAPSFGLVREDWDLAPIGYASEPPTAPGEVVRHDAPRYWVFARGPTSIGSGRVHPIFARLLTQAARRPLGEALAAVRRACQPAQVRVLDERLSHWLELAAESGWWIGLGPS